MYWLYSGCNDFAYSVFTFVSLSAQFLQGTYFSHQSRVVHQIIVLWFQVKIQLFDKIQEIEYQVFLIITNLDVEIWTENYANYVSWHRKDLPNFFTFSDHVSDDQLQYFQEAPNYQRTTNECASG